MTRSKSIGKKVACKHHRQTEYLKALDKLFDGQCNPDYPHLRFEKLKEVKK
jgi:hypothetical protein